MQRPAPDVGRPGQRVRQGGYDDVRAAESLGVVTPASVSRDGQGTGQTVATEFDPADASTLGDVTGEAVEK